MTRRTIAALALTSLLAGCGGGGSSPSSPSSGVEPSRVVVLGGGNFEPLVLASARPSLVEFQLPT